jgi:hypothetical protein
MKDSTADVVAVVECRRSSLEGLIAIAERVDRFVGTPPPDKGYGLGEAVSAVLNGGTIEDIQAAFSLLSGWTFQPAGAPH